MISPIHLKGDLKSWNRKFLSSWDPSSRAECARTIEIPNAYLCQNYARSDLNRAFLRASIFVEGGGDVRPGTVVSLRDALYLKQSQEVLGHDLKSADLHAFYKALKKACKEKGEPEFCPTQEEKDLLSHVLMPASKEQKHFVVISFSATDPGGWLSTVSHEVCHAQFFTQKKYEQTVNRFWKRTLTNEEREKVKSILEDDYDSSNAYLMANEFQAYLLEIDALSGEMKEFVPRYRDELMEKLTKAGVPPLQLK